MKIKICPADKVFSQYIRLRDKRCMRCGSRVEFNAKGLPVSHEASHYFGRGKESTRFNQKNVDCLCFACHRIWGSDDKEAYRNFKIKQLGEEGFNLLLLNSNMYCKRDRKLALIIAKERLKKLEGKSNRDSEI